MKRKFVVGLLVVCLVASLLAVTAFADTAAYTDVTKDDWYYDAVTYCQEKNLMGGIGGNKFAPKDEATRGMVVTILWRLAGEPSGQGAYFADVDSDDYFARATLWAAQEKIVEGYGNNKFGPNDVVTREQLATFLYRYCKWAGYDVSAKADLDDFADGAAVSAYAVDAMSWAVAEGLMQGMGENTLSPKTSANRAQMAVLLSRMEDTLEKAEEEKPVDPEPAVPVKPYNPGPPHACRYTYSALGNGQHVRSCTCGIKIQDCSYGNTVETATCQYCGTVCATPDTLKGLVAAAEDGAAIVLMAGHYETISFTKATAANLTLTAAEGVTVGTVRLVETKNYGCPEGLTLNNIVFTGEGITSSGSGNSVKDLAVMGCEFKDGAVIHISDGTTDGLKVESCTFRKTDSSVNAKEKTAILVQNNASNVEITMNSISNCEFNAIQLTKIVGAATITDNVITSTGSRAIRLSAKAGAELVITNNIIAAANTDPAEAADNNGEVIKISGAVTNNTPLAGYDNTVDGLPMAWEEDSADLYAYKAAARIGDAYYASLTAAAADVMAGETITMMADATYDVAPRENNAIGAATDGKITIDGVGEYTLNFNQTNSDWNNVITNGATLVLKNMNITNSGHNDGPWNRHDIYFACAVELENVNSDKALAFKTDAKLTKVTINDANIKDTYAIWIQPNGQTVTLDGCTIDMIACTDGRGIKIDEQYVDAPAKVTLSVSNTSFQTEEKSAILVKSAAGADITLSNVDISAVAADSVNVVWVDSASAAHYDKVVVTGGSKVQE